MNEEKDLFWVRRINSAVVMVFAVTLSISFVVSSIMFAEKATRRTADELKIINESERVGILSTEDKIKSCVESGGMPNYDNGLFADCRVK